MIRIAAGLYSFVFIIVFLWLLQMHVERKDPHGIVGDLFFLLLAVVALLGWLRG